ncbi:unnamed protein product [Peniophora sp. CBMAI 1063]|nr:unnamed protein product [Peniophora sp. CBMAI 1063]
METASLSPPPIFRLPNELLAEVARFLGPPDISRADPGWLVLSTVCTLLHEVARALPEWESATSDDPDSFFTRYSWSVCPDTSENTHYVVADERVGAYWTIHPVCSAVNPYYLDGLLHLAPSSVNLDAQQAMTRYLTSSPSSPPLGKSPRLNLSWIRRIELDCWMSDDHMGDIVEFSFTDVPCLVAPALEELYLCDYVVDWRCNGLVVLSINLDGLVSNGNFPNHGYTCTQLLERLDDSSLTMQYISLSHCFLPLGREEIDSKEHLSLIHLPRITTSSVVLQDRPHQTWWIRQNLALPPGADAIFAWPGLAIGFLRQLASLCPQIIMHGPNCSDCAMPDAYGPVTMIDFAATPEGSSYACSVQGYFHGELGHMRESEYPKSGPCTGHDEVLDWDDKVGVRPRFVFEMHCHWNVASWDAQLEGDDPADTARDAVLDLVDCIYIHGKRGLLAHEDGVATWTTVLRNFPRVRSLHVVGPTATALQPLCDQQVVLPELETIFLSAGVEDEGSREVNAEWLLEVCERRKELQAGTGCPSISLSIPDSIRIVGATALVERLREFGVFRPAAMESS